MPTPEKWRASPWRWRARPRCRAKRLTMRCSLEAWQRRWPLSFLLRGRPGGRCAMYNPRDMRLKTNGFRSIALIAAGSPLRGLCAVGCLILGASLAAQRPAPARPDGAARGNPTFRARSDPATNAVIVPEEKGNSIPDRKREAIEVV